MDLAFLTTMVGGVGAGHVDPSVHVQVQLALLRHPRDDHEAADRLGPQPCRSPFFFAKPSPLGIRLPEARNPLR